MAEEQAEFRQGKGTIARLFWLVGCLRNTVRWTAYCTITSYISNRHFDNVWHRGLWLVLRNCRDSWRADEVTGRPVRASAGMGKRGHLPPPLWKCREIFLCISSYSKTLSTVLFMHFFTTCRRFLGVSLPDPTRLHPRVPLGTFVPDP